MSFQTENSAIQTALRRTNRKRRIRFYALVFGLSVAATIFLILAILPFKYEAKVDVLVRLDRDSAAVPQVGRPGADQIVVTGVRPEDVSTEISLMTSRGVAVAAWEALGPDFFIDEDDEPENFRQRIVFFVRDTLEGLADWVNSALIRLRLAKESTPREDAISSVMTALHVSKSVRSDLITMQVRGGSPEEARSLLEAIVDAYLEAHQGARSVFRGNDLFKELEALTEAEMAELGDEIEAIKSEQEVFDFPLWIEQRTLRVAELQNLANEHGREVGSLDQQIARAKADLQDIEASPMDVEPLNANALISELRVDLGRAIKDAKREIARYGRVSQQAQEAEAVIEALRAEIRATDLAETRRLIRQLEREKALIELRAASLREQIDVFVSEIEQLSDLEAKMRSLETRRDAVAVGLAEVTGDRARAEWLAALDANGPARIRILKPITASTNPVAPNKVVLMVAGLVAAFIMAAGLYIVLDQIFVLDRLGGAAKLMSRSQSSYSAPREDDENANSVSARGQDASH